MFLCSRLRCVGRNFLDYWRGSAAQKIWRMSKLVWNGSTTDMTLRHHMTEMCQDIRFGDQTSTEIKIWRTLWRVFEVVWISFDTVCRLWSETIWRRLCRGTYWRRHEIPRLASELTWKEEVDDDTALDETPSWHQTSERSWESVLLERFTKSCPWSLNSGRAS